MTCFPSRAPSRGWKCHVLVLAKAPVPGRVKTRLCPPLTLAEAAALAKAALADTLDAVARSGAERRVLALDGAPGEWLPPGFEVIPQRGDSLDERLAAAWADVAGPGLQIGMDTPQVTPRLLDDCLEGTFGGVATASLGRANDGGWWAVGLAQHWDVDVFTGVAMSTPFTASIQRRRLEAAGHIVGDLPMLTDVDHIEDAFHVARLSPASRLAGVTRSLSPRVRGVA